MSDSSDAGKTSALLGDMAAQTDTLSTSATTFARTMTGAFTSSVSSGQKFDDLLKTLGSRLSGLALSSSLQLLSGAATSGIGRLATSLFGTAGSSVKPFAAGGVIGAPSYFPLDGGTGVAGEAGPEAIMPLARGADGRLGVAGAAGATTVNVQITAPDPAAFRRSESYLSGQIARAVARGQRNL